MGKKRGFSLFMAFVLSVSMFMSDLPGMIVNATGTVSQNATVQEQDDVTEIDVDQAVTKDMSDYLKAGECVIKINGEEITGKTGEIDVPYGSKISIDLKWKFADNTAGGVGFPTKIADEFVYTLPSNISLTDSVIELKEGPVVVGHAYLSGNTIRVKYDDPDYGQNFINRTDRKGELSADGNLGGDVTNDGEGGKTTFVFPGIGTYVTNMQRDTSKDGLDVEKIGSKVDEVTMTSDWKIKIKATGVQSNVLVKDSMGDYMTMNGGVSFYKDEACTIPYTGAVTGAVNSDGKGFSYTITGMSNETIYAKYRTNVDKTVLVEDSWENYDKKNNTIHVRSNTTPEKTYAATLNYTKKGPWANKNGSYTEGSDEIEWSVTLNPNGYDIDGSVIKDILGDTVGDYIDGSFYSEVPGLTSWNQLQSGYTIPAGTNGTYKITYKTKVGDLSETKKIEKKNTFVINPYGNTKDISIVGSLTIGKDHVYIEKKCLTTDNTDTVKWQVTVHVPKAGMTDLNVEEIIPNGMNYIDGSFQLISKPGRYTGTVTVDNSDAAKPVFQFGNVGSGTMVEDFVFTLETKIETVPTVQTEYKNTVVCKEGSKECGKADAAYTSLGYNQ